MIYIFFYMRPRISLRCAPVRQGCVPDGKIRPRWTWKKGPRWESTHMGERPLGRAPTWESTHMGERPHGRAPTWETAHLGERPHGRPPRWERTHMGEGVRWENPLPCGFFPIWAVSHVGALPSGLSHMGPIFPTGTYSKNIIILRPSGQIVIITKFLRLQIQIL